MSDDTLDKIKILLDLPNTTPVNNTAEEPEEEKESIPTKILNTIKSLTSKIFSKPFTPESEPVKKDEEKRNIFLIDRIFHVLAVYLYSNMLIAIVSIIMNYPYKTLDQWIMFLLSNLIPLI